MSHYILYKEQKCLWVLVFPFECAHTILVPLLCWDECLSPHSEEQEKGTLKTSRTSQESIRRTEMRNRKKNISKIHSFGRNGWQPTKISSFIKEKGYLHKITPPPKKTEKKMLTDTQLRMTNIHITKCNNKTNASVVSRSTSVSSVWF